MRRARAGLLVAFLLAISAPAAAQVDDSLGEDFEAEADPPGWSMDPQYDGEWVVDGGGLNGWGHAWYSYVAHDWEDLEVRALLALEGGLHLNFRVGDGHRYRFWIGTSAEEGSVVIELIRDTPGESRLIERVGPSEFDRELDVVAAVWGGELYFGVNDLAIEWTDAEPLGAGRFGFESLPDTPWVWIDWVELSGTLPSPPQAVGLPDLAIEEFAAAPLDAERVEITALVRNVGESTADPGVVLVEFSGDPLAEIRLPDSLAPGDVAGLSAVVEVPGDWQGTSGRAVARIEAGEDADPGNNSAVIPLTFLESSFGRDPDDGTRRETAQPPAPTPPDENGGVDYVLPALGGGVLIAAAGGYSLARRARLQRQRRARDDYRRDRCRPGRDRYVHRSWEPDLRRRKVTGFTLAGATTGGERIDGSFEGRKLLRRVNRALDADRLNDAERCERHLDDASSRLAAAIGAWVDEHPTVSTGQLEGRYEGASATGEFTQWVCNEQGEWPDPERDAPRRRWTAKVSDAGSVLAGTLDTELLRSGALLERELRRQLGVCIRTLCERRTPRPLNVDADLRTGR